MKRNFVKVVVHVEDCNDHSPAFLRPRYQANISNMAAAGSEVVRVKALDKDTGINADIIYSLHSGEQRRDDGADSLFQRCDRAPCSSISFLFTVSPGLSPALVSMFYCLRLLLRQTLRGNIITSERAGTHDFHSVVVIYQGEITDHVPLKLRG